MKKFAALLLVFAMAAIALSSCKSYDYNLDERFEFKPDYKNGLSIEEKNIVESLESQIESLIDANTKWVEQFQGDRDPVQTEENGKVVTDADGKAVPVTDEDGNAVTDYSLRDRDKVNADIIGFPQLKDDNGAALDEFASTRDSFWSGTKQDLIINGTEAESNKWSTVPGFDSQLMEDGTLPPPPPETTKPQTDENGSTITTETSSIETSAETTTEQTTTEQTSGVPVTDENGDTVTDEEGQVVTETVPVVTTSAYESLSEDSDYIRIEVKISEDFGNADYEDYRGLKVVFFVKINSVKENEIPDFDDDFVKEQSKYDSVESYKNGEYEAIRRSLAFSAVYDAFIVKKNGYPKKEMKEIYKSQFMYTINYTMYYALYAYGYDLSTYSYKEVIEFSGEDYDEFLKSLANYAARMVKREMVLYYIERTENLEAEFDSNMYDKYSKKAFEEYNRTNIDNETPDFVSVTNEADYLKSSGVKKQAFHDQLLHDYTIDKIKEWVKVIPDETAANN